MVLKGESMLALAPIVRRLSLHDAFLHFGVCEVLDPVCRNPTLHLYGAEGGAHAGASPYSALAIVS